MPCRQQHGQLPNVPRQKYYSKNTKFGAENPHLGKFSGKMQSLITTSEMCSCLLEK